MTERTVVPGVETLKAMARAGLIKLHADTGKKVRHWSGQITTAYYIDDVCAGVCRPFKFLGREYTLKYFDGCFCPFVVDIDFAKEIGVDLNKPLIA